MFNGEPPKKRRSTGNHDNFFDTFVENMTTLRSAYYTEWLNFADKAIASVITNENGVLSVRHNRPTPEKTVPAEVRGIKKNTLTSSNNQSVLTQQSVPSASAIIADPLHLTPVHLPNQKVPFLQQGSSAQNIAKPRQVRKGKDLSKILRLDLSDSSDIDDFEVEAALLTSVVGKLPDLLDDQISQAFNEPSEEEEIEHPDV
ncbi:hypothetical protein KQX54_001195 [Cotesia glomerata]|uniref:Uncharacterized protein n=1 Tax=Cotesia glomerata TaxID=32391 RepID=A0AAV7J0V2_COTGL|nr:hypothetical protein KQX54_001195 [Cotesia glomerata]